MENLIKKQVIKHNMVKNKLRKYLDKTSQHLFTKDGEKFMKIIPIETSEGLGIIKLKFGGGYLYCEFSHVEKSNRTSPRGKEYVAPEFKHGLFDWCNDYYSVKGGKQYSSLFKELATLVPRNLTYKGYDNESKTNRNMVSDKIEKYFIENSIN